MQDAKPFGYELVDIKLSGVIARLTSTRYRLRYYIDGRVKRLEELEADRSPTSSREPPNAKTSGTASSAAQTLWIQSNNLLFKTPRSTSPEGVLLYVSKMHYHF